MRQLTNTAEKPFHDRSNSRIPACSRQQKFIEVYEGDPFEEAPEFWTGPVGRQLAVRRRTGQWTILQWATRTRTGRRQRRHQCCRCRRARNGRNPVHGDRRSIPAGMDLRSAENGTDRQRLHVHLTSDGTLPVRRTKTNPDKDQLSAYLPEFLLSRAAACRGYSGGSNPLTSETGTSAAGMSEKGCGEPYAQSPNAALAEARRTDGIAKARYGQFDGSLTLSGAQFTGTFNTFCGMRPVTGKQGWLRPC